MNDGDPSPANPMLSLGPVSEDRGWECGWEDSRRHQLTAGLLATPAQRLAWLEEMIVLAYRARALPRSESPAMLLRDAPIPERKKGGL